MKENINIKNVLSNFLLYFFTLVLSGCSTTASYVGMDKNPRQAPFNVGVDKNPRQAPFDAANKIALRKINRANAKRSIAAIANRLTKTKSDVEADNEVAAIFLRAQEMHQQETYNGKNRYRPNNPICSLSYVQSQRPKPKW